MRSDGPKLEQVIAAIRHELVQRVLDQLKDYSRICESSVDQIDAEKMTWLHFECHKINGIAKSVGLDALGAAAVTVEDLVASVVDGSKDLPSELPKIRAALRDLTLEVQNCAERNRPDSIEASTS